jgi:hypothetical protein
MGLARKLEQRLEQLVDGLSSTLFRGGMHPVELAGRLVRRMDLLVTEGDLGPGIPNDITLSVNPKDLPEDIDRSALEHELAAAVAATAAERGWRTGGAIRVTVEPVTTVGAGSIAVEAWARPIAGTPWAQLIDTRDGTAYAVDDNRVVIGRSSTADVTVTDAEVSRRHALLVRRAGALWMSDLASANGTRVNGVPIDGEPREVHVGDQLRLGATTLSLRLL